MRHFLTLQGAPVLIAGAMAAIAVPDFAIGQTVPDLHADPLPPVSCLIEPDQIVRLSTPVAGIVAQVNIDRGDVVQAGQILARLDTTLEDIELTAARARAADTSRLSALETQITFLRNQAERNERLAANNAVSETAAREARLEAELADRDLDQARLDQALEELAVTEAEARLEQKIVRSPLDGVVLERLLNPGEYRDGEAHIATLARLDKLRVEAFVPIAYYDKLQVGQTVRILPEPPLDRFVEARISVIDRVFDAATATVGVRMDLPNPGLALPAGLRCEVHFDATATARE